MLCNAFSIVSFCCSLEWLKPHQWKCGPFHFHGKNKQRKNTMNNCRIICLKTFPFYHSHSQFIIGRQNENNAHIWFKCNKQFKSIVGGKFEVFFYSQKAIIQYGILRGTFSNIVYAGVAGLSPLSSSECIHCLCYFLINFIRYLELYSIVPLTILLQLIQYTYSAC